MASEVRAGDKLRELPTELHGELPEEVRYEVINRIGVITLNRPRALNALSHGMVTSLWRQLQAWAVDADINAVLIEGEGEKAFCAGGDVRALYESRVSGATRHRDFFVDEYRLDYLIHRYPKPYVALMDGIVMGGGMGLSQGASLRIVTDRTKLAMPETGIGLFPDVGASWFLGHIAPTLARYLGLTGATIGPADALYAGLADVWLPADAPARMREALRSLDWSTAGTDAYAVLRAAILPLGQMWADDAPLAAARASIDRHFSAPDVLAMAASLAADRASEWAATTLAMLSQRSPLMLWVTDRQLAMGRRLDLADAFRLELVLGHHAFESGDFVEGVRALLIDKDKSPRWRFATLDAVPQAAVDAAFASPWSPGQHPLAELGKVPIVTG